MVNNGDCPESALGGMLLRDYFAAQALQGMVAGYADIREKNWITEKSHADKIAEQAFYMADAMLRERVRNAKKER